MLMYSLKLQYSYNYKFIFEKNFFCDKLCPKIPQTFIFVCHEKNISSQKKKMLRNQNIAKIHFETSSLKEKIQS